MIEVIREGGSVTLGGIIYTNVADLPSEVELAQGDPVKEAAAVDALKAEIERLHSQLRTVQPEVVAEKATSKKKDQE